MLEENLHSEMGGGSTNMKTNGTMQLLIRVLIFDGISAVSCNILHELNLKKRGAVFQNDLQYQLAFY